MKRLALAFLLLISLSCADKETYCYECTVTGDEGNSTFNRCDITESECADIERSGTVIEAACQGCYSVRHIKKTTCVKV